MHHCWICGRELDDSDNPESVETRKGECACCVDAQEGWGFYYGHPESSCIWKANEEETDTDGLVVEIDAGQFYAWLNEGWSDGTIPF